MKTYTIGEIEELLEIKAHVLRYWEEVVPSIAPKKTVGGQREYTERDFETLQRLKFLIQEKKFTIEGARNQLLLESGQKSQVSDQLKEIRALRNELSELYLTVRKYR